MATALASLDARQFKLLKGVLFVAACMPFLRLVIFTITDQLGANPVDVLCLQELKMSDDKFPLEVLKAAGYDSAVFGQKTYNGVAILSRAPVRDVLKNIGGFADDHSRVISGTIDTPASRASRT